MNQYEITDDEADKYKTIDVAPINPAAPPQFTEPRGTTFSTTLAPQFQHDGTFVDTKYPINAGVPATPLLPLPAATAAQVQSTITKIIETGASGTVNVKFEVNGTPASSQVLQNIAQGSNMTIQDQGNGKIVFNSTGGSSFVPQWPLPNTALAFMARAIVGVTSLQTIGDASTSNQNSGGTIANGTVPNTNDGVSVEMGSGSGHGQFTGFFPLNSKIFWAGRSTVFQGRIRFLSSSDISNGFVWIGMTDQTPTNMRSTTPTGANLAAFLYNGGPNWSCVVGNAGVFTTVGSGVAADTVTHTYQVVMNDVSNTATFYIDNNVVATISGSNPSGVGWFPEVMLSNTTATNVNLNLQYIYAQQSF